MVRKLMGGPGSALMRHSKNIGWCSMLGAVMAGGTASAQHPLVLDRLTVWNAAAPTPPEEELKRLVHQKAVAIYRDAKNCGASDVRIVKVVPATADRYAFSGIMNRTIRNAWFVTAQVPGCDAEQVRFMVLWNADDTFKIVRINRGESYAWESLVTDTVPLARLAAIAALQRIGTACDSGSTEGSGLIGPTRISAQDLGLGKEVFGVRYTGKWNEIWPISECGHVVEVTIEFTADGDGGAYTRMPAQRVRVVR